MSLTSRARAPPNRRFSTCSMSPQPGEIWKADLGLAAKTRPIIIVSRQDPDPPRSLVLYVPLTTQRRDSPYEVPTPASVGAARAAIQPLAILCGGFGRGPPSHKFTAAQIPEPVPPGTPPCRPPPRPTGLS